MHPSLDTKKAGNNSDTRNEPFSLTSTLEQYEVEELDAREIAHILAEKRRREGGVNPADA